VGFGVDANAKNYPEGACRFVAEQHAPGPLFNSYNFGSYLMHCLGKDHPVFIDQRAWSLYSDRFARQYKEAPLSLTALQTLLKKYPSLWAIVQHDDYAVLLGQDPDWTLVYFDDKALVFTKTHDARVASVVANDAFVYLPPRRLLNLPDLRPEFVPGARAELVRQKKNCADCFHTYLVAAGLALAQKDMGAFDRAMEHLAPNADTQQVTYLLARRSITLGDHQKAFDLLERFRVLGGDPSAALLFQTRALLAQDKREEALHLLADPTMAPKTRPLVENLRREIEAAP